jgi:hypothetical protein
LTGASSCFVEQQDFFCTGGSAAGFGFALLPQQPPGAGVDTGFGLLPQQPPSCTGDSTGFGLQQLETVSFCAGSKRGVELALEGSDAALLPLVSEGVYVIDEASVLASKPA